MKLFDREFNETVEKYALKQIMYDGIMIADINGIIRYFRQYNRSIIPFDVNEVVGKHILEVYTDIREEKSTGGIMGKRLQVEKYIILFAIGGMAYFFWKCSSGDTPITRCFCAEEPVLCAAGF